MRNHCFICKLCKDTKPIGLKKMGCKEIYICQECNAEMKEIKQSPKPLWIQLTKASKIIH